MNARKEIRDHLLAARMKPWLDIARCPLMNTELRPHTSRFYPNPWVVAHVLVPLGVRALHGQEAEPSTTNQTGIEIVRPDFLPTTLILI